MQHLKTSFLTLTLFVIGCATEDEISPSGEDTAEVGGNGTFSTTTSCGAWKSPATGNSHAGIQACTIIWGKDTLSDPSGTEYYQQVRFQLRDEETDGGPA